MRNLYKRLGLLTVMLLVVSMVTAHAQSSVSGTIIDETGSPIPGVSILEKGTSNGTTTDTNGKYTISVGPNATLIFSFIGYASQEASAAGRTTLDVTLQPDVTSLEEVVVTGYSTENRKDITGAVSTVKTAQLVAVPSGNVEQQLQGRVAGVTVITNGQPGTTSVIRVRGFGAIGGNEPLYIVDGTPVESTDFLNPDDIETTTVLKDAATASIYGARAANGVVVYTTKRGKKGSGKLSINYDAVFGVTTPGKVDNILNPQEQADWTWKAIANTATQVGTTPVFENQQYRNGPGNTALLPDYILVGPNSGVVGNINLEAERENYNTDPSKGPYYLVMKANKQGTNWWDELTQSAPLQRHTLSFSGGGDKSNFYVSLGMQDQDGILIHQSFKRYTLRINSEHSLHDKFRIGHNFQGTYLAINGLIGGNGGRGAANEETQVLSAFRMPAIIPVYDEFGGYAGTAAKGFNNPRNPVAERNRSADNYGYGIQGFGNVYAELDILKGLTLRTSAGGRLGSSYYYFYNRPSYENSENGNDFITYGEGSSAYTSWVFANTARYQTRIADQHSVDVLVGVESLNTPAVRNIDGTGQRPFSPDPAYITLTTTSNRTVNSNNNLGIRFFSYFGKLNYTFRDKYLLSGTVRRDGSSRFGANTRYGVFPAISAGWRISEEAFMSGVEFISDLKIRGGWGQMGNSNNVNPMNQYSLFASDLGLAYYDISGSNGSPTEGFYRNRIGNPNAKWETSTTSNIGIDGTFFDGKLEVILDFWRKDTEDLLYALETPAVIGPLAADPSINIAKMRNQGLDLQIINKGNIIPGLTYEINATGSFLKNEIVFLAPGVDYFEAGGTRHGNVIRNQVGHSISSYFGYKVVGLFQDQADVNSSPAQDGKGIGRFKYADVNGDGSITPEDRTYLGSPVPDFTGGLNLTLGYKNFELTTFLYMAFGFENYNFSKWFTDFYPSFTGAAYGNNVKDSFTFENGGNTVPIFENISNISTNNAPNSYFIEKGNFARLTNLQIAYKLPVGLLSRVGIERAKIYVQGTNLFTISNYSGLDPGVGGGADTTLGIDVGNPPVTRGYNIGINIGI
jgi:TonB-dependent starch-binding outer membrane protein SusC